MIIWLYGAPYSGKTTFANKFPDPFFISLDRNAQYLTDHYENCNTIDEYSGAVKRFLSDPGDYKTLVIDNIDLLEQYVREYYLDKLDIEDESDREDFGKAWRLVREGTYQAILSPLKFKGDIILISQEDVYSTKSRLGTEVTNYRPGVNLKLHSRISSLTTLIMRSIKDTKKISGEEVNRYYISIGSNTNELSGTRIPIKETLIDNDYEQFKNILGGK